VDVVYASAFGLTQWRQPRWATYVIKYSLLHLFSILGICLLSSRFDSSKSVSLRDYRFLFPSELYCTDHWGFPQLLSYGGHSSIHPLKTTVVISFPDTLYPVPYRATAQATNGPHRPRAEPAPYGTVDISLAFYHFLPLM
jgi:hypothetical protein